MAIIFVVLAWRLSSGPISLAFLNPVIEQALNDPQRAITVTLDDTILTWAGWQRTLDIRAVNVRAVGPDGGLIAQTPELSLSISMAALLHGQVAPKSIELFNPRLRLIRQREGGFQVVFADGANNSDALFNGILENLTAGDSSDSPMRYLTRIRIVGADLTVDDERSGQIWRAPGTRIELRREADGIRAEATLDLEAEGISSDLALVASYHAADRRIDVGASVSAVNPRVFARLTPALAEFKRFDMPLQGTVTMSMTMGGDVESVGFDLTGGAGSLLIPAPMEQTLSVAGAVLRGRYDGSSGELDLDEVTVDLGPKGALLAPGQAKHAVPLRSVSARIRYEPNNGVLDIESLNADLRGPKLVASGTLREVDGDRILEAKGALRGTSVDELPQYWPAGWGVDARKWCLENLSAGRVDEARATLRARQGKDGDFKVEVLKGDMDIAGVTVEYLDQMPKVYKVNGTAAFNRKQFDIRITGGRSTGLNVPKGRILITGLDEKDQYADVNLTINGPVVDAMKLIDHKPFRFASTLGLTPEKTGGTASTQLKLYFELKKDLQTKDVTVSATSKLTDVFVADAVFDLAIKHARLNLKVDGRGMDVRGDGFLGTIPAKLSWRQNFDDNAPFRARYDISGRVDQEQRIGELGLDFPPFSGDFLTGPTAAQVRYTVFDDGNSRLNAKLDLAQAGLHLNTLGWSKAPNVPGSAEVEVRLLGDQLREVSHFAVDAGDLTLNGSAKFGDKGVLQRIDLDHVAYGRTDMTVRLLPTKGDGWAVTLHGKSFDLEPTLDSLLHSKPDSGAEKPDRGKPIRFAASVNTLWVGKDRKLTGVSGTFSHDGEKWRQIDLTGHVEDSADLSLSLQPVPGDKRQLSIRSDNAGAALRTFDVYDNMIGGKLDLSGEFDDTKKGSPLTGRIRVDNYHVIKAPTLARVISVLALTGILDALKGDGLAFNILDAPFVLHNGMLDIKNARASGSSLGFTASGKLNTDTKQVDLEGTVVPAYVVNSVLGHIPVLGNLLVGGKQGNGVFAATYKMTGPIDEPEVSINPLSALTPGILRRIFDLMGRRDSTSELPPDRPKGGRH